MTEEVISDKDFREIVAEDKKAKEKIVPIAIKKIRDKFGFHKVFMYDGLEMLTEIIRHRIKEQQNHQDSVFLVSGLEGAGKSLFTLWACAIYADETQQNIEISHVTRTLKELFKKIYVLRDNPSIITLDEGSELDGTNSSTKEVKLTKKKFTIMRKCSHIIMLCFVNPLRITTYFREDRVRGLFFVVKQGEVWYYSNNQNNPHLANIIDSWSKEHEAKSLKFLKTYAPDMILKGIPEYRGELRKQYESRKDENIFDILKDDEDDAEASPVDYLEGVDWLSISHASKVTGLTERRLREIYITGKLETKKIRHRIHFNKKELLEFVNNGSINRGQEV